MIHEENTGISAIVVAQIFALLGSLNAVHGSAIVGGLHGCESLKEEVSSGDQRKSGQRTFDCGVWCLRTTSSSAKVNRMTDLNLRLERGKAF